jgi:hypothetical protein
MSRNEYMASEIKYCELIEGRVGADFMLFEVSIKVFMELFKSGRFEDARELAGGILAGYGMYKSPGILWGIYVSADMYKEATGSNRGFIALEAAAQDKGMNLELMMSKPWYMRLNPRFFLSKKYSRAARALIGTVAWLNILMIFICAVWVIPMTFHTSVIFGILWCLFFLPRMVK